MIKMSVFMVEWKMVVISTRKTRITMVVGISGCRKIFSSNRKLIVDAEESRPSLFQLGIYSTLNWNTLAVLAPEGTLS
jgi:hypothetical protein